MDLLEAAGFSKANPYYVVKQGKVGGGSCVCLCDGMGWLTYSTVCGLCISPTPPVSLSQCRAWVRGGGWQQGMLWPWPWSVWCGGVGWGGVEGCACCGVGKCGESIQLGGLAYMSKACCQWVGASGKEVCAAARLVGLSQGGIYSLFLSHTLIMLPPPAAVGAMQIMSMANMRDGQRLELLKEIGEQGTGQ